jgi:hypothetical protein
VNNGDMMAFPVQAADAIGSMYAQSGLTKRELFAAMAMQGRCALSIPGSHQQAGLLATEAVEIADALLAALSSSAGEKP